MSPATPSPHPTPATPATEALEQRLTELEIKASYADDLLDTLNALVARQQETIELLVREVSRLRQQGGSDGASAGLRDPRDELPPHY
ncbi:MAG: SlyX family protein [Hydrogenophaga sp.]|jgi:SlyX protein|nr:SlyX family protein [Hydrogenophaga sp.]